MTHELDTSDGGADAAPDIAWLRTLAQEGADTPLGGGPTLMAAGLIFGLASLAQWTAMVGIGPISLQVSNWIWLGATVVFVVAVFVTSRMCASQGIKTVANRAARAAWSFVGWGIFALVASLAAVGWRMGPQALLLVSLLPSAVMVFYGLGWGVSAAMTRSATLRWLAIASLVAAPLLGLLVGRPELYLAYAVCLFALMALPGWILLRRASRT
ncbi:hypothetical protein BH10PSE2_BH10PSE2_13840 [soil metagenome]